MPPYAATCSQVSFGAPTGLRSLAILHTAAPGFDGIIAFRQVPCAFASPVTDRLLSRYGREQIHDAGEWSHAFMHTYCDTHSVSGNNTASCIALLVHLACRRMHQL
jgi:hypothetical protein